MTAPADVTCIGEVLVDFVSARPTTSLSTAASFVKAAGGAPANVAAGLARLGIRTSFVGAVGADSFGAFLTSELRRCGVETDGMVSTTAGKTRLAFVAVTSTGDRDFEFWERHPADQLLRPEDIDLDRVTRSKVINIGAFLLLNDPAREAAFAAAREMTRRGGSVCFDPNVRMSLWPSRSDLKRVAWEMMRTTRILRMNEDEARFFTDADDLAVAARRLLDLGPAVVVITEGRGGCTVAVDGAHRHVDGFRVRAVDTTGCGDGFLAGLLAGIVRSPQPVDEMDLEELASICRTANAVGALVAMTRGAIPAMPSMPQVRRFLRQHSRGRRAPRSGNRRRPDGR